MYDGANCLEKGDVTFEETQRPMRSENRKNIQQHLRYAKPYRRTDILSYSIRYRGLLFHDKQPRYERVRWH